MHVLGRIAAVAAALILTAPSVAQASLYLIFRPAHVSPGDVVRVRSGGRGALALVPPGTLLPVYLAPLKVSGDITSSSDPALISVGSLRVDKAGNGSLWFTVPRMPSGRYQAFILCGRWCAPYSAGRRFLPATLGAALEVSSNIPPGGSGSGGLSRFQELGIAIAAAVGIAGALAVARRRA